MTVVTYSMWKLGKFLVWREEWENAYYVIKRDVFDKLKNTDQAKFIFDNVTIFTPSFGDETLGKLFDEYPQKLIIDIKASYPVKKALETIEITRKIKFLYW